MEDQSRYRSMIAFGLDEMEVLMDKKRLKHYKDLLLVERAKLSDVAGRFADHGREADTEATQDTVDKASNSYSKELFFRQSTNDRQTLALIDEALERIEDGTFGICPISGREIEPKRLEAVPWAKYTIEVQESIERGELEEE